MRKLIWSNNELSSNNWYLIKVLKYFIMSPPTRPTALVLTCTGSLLGVIGKQVKSETVIMKSVRVARKKSWGRTDNFMTVLIILSIADTWHPMHNFLQITRNCNKTKLCFHFAEYRYCCGWMIEYILFYKSIFYWIFGRFTLNLWSVPFANDFAKQV